MAEVELKNVSKIYNGATKVVKDANLYVSNNEFVVLVGPSGCGKSTTLRMVAGLEEITDGEIFIDGKLVNNISPKDRDIAMVFQNYALYPHMTVYDNMAFGLKLRKLPKEVMAERVNEAAKILGLEDLLGRKPKALSGGQRQRVAVGRAIVRKPKVFLFDEPLSNLDAKLRVQMRTEISKLHKKLNATIIYVTHDQVEAMTMGDKIVVMKDGEVQQIDSPLNLYNNPVNKFTAGFIGSPSMNFINGILHKRDQLSFIINNENRITLPQKYEECLDQYSGKELIMGIRPEDINDSEKTGIKDSQKIECIVEIVEQMGNEIFVHFKINNNPMIARVNPTADIKAAIKTDLFFNTSKLYFFDHSGKCIS